MKTLKSFCFSGALALVICLNITADGQTKSANRYVLSHDGFGPIRIGMTVKQATQALGVSLVAEDDPNNDCYYVSPKRDSRFRKLSFMVTGGRISRIDSDDKSFVTAEGAKVGDTETKIKRLYKGKLKVTKHFYTDGHYLTVDRGKYSIVFETDGNRVTYIRAGKSPEVDYVEGCS